MLRLTRVGELIIGPATWKKQRSYLLEPVVMVGPCRGQWTRCESIIGRRSIVCDFLGSLPYQADRRRVAVEALLDLEDPGLVFCVVVDFRRVGIGLGLTAVN